MARNNKKVKPTETDVKHKVVNINRVAKVTKGGRTFSFSVVVVAGDGEGAVGHGLGKALDVTGSIDKGREDAVKSMIRIPVYKGAIPHEVIGKFGAAKVLLRPASKGTGVIAGGAMRAVLDMAGVKNVIAKSLGSSNPHNVVKATINALASLRSPQQVAKERGISVDKVFNG